MNADSRPPRDPWQLSPEEIARLQDTLRERGWALWQRPQPPPLGPSRRGLGALISRAECKLLGHDLLRVIDRAMWERSNLYRITESHQLCLRCGETTTAFPPQGAVPRLGRRIAEGLSLRGLKALALRAGRAAKCRFGHASGRKFYTKGMRRG